MNSGNPALRVRYGDSLPAERGKQTVARPVRKAATVAKPAIRPESLSRSAQARAAGRVRVGGQVLNLRAGAVLGFALVLSLLFFIVYASMQISMLSKESNAIYKELNALQAQEQKLRNEYESLYSLSEVENYALNVLGMVKPGREQIMYVNLAGEDCAVILPQKTFWEVLGSFFASIQTDVVDFLG